MPQNLAQTESQSPTLTFTIRGTSGDFQVVSQRTAWEKASKFVRDNLHDTTGDAVLQIEKHVSEMPTSVLLALAAFVEVLAEEPHATQSFLADDTQTIALADAPWHLPRRVAETEIGKLWTEVPPPTKADKGLTRKLLALARAADFLRVDAALNVIAVILARQIAFLPSSEGNTATVDRFRCRTCTAEDTDACSVCEVWKQWHAKFAAELKAFTRDQLPLRL